MVLPGYSQQLECIIFIIMIGIHHSLTISKIYKMEFQFFWSDSKVFGKVGGLTIPDQTMYYVKYQGHWTRVIVHVKFQTVYFECAHNIPDLPCCRNCNSRELRETDPIRAKVTSETFIRQMMEQEGMERFISEVDEGILQYMEEYPDDDCVSDAIVSDECVSDDEEDIQFDQWGIICDV
jgi:hypothetical protein